MHKKRQQGELLALENLRPVLWLLQAA